MEFVTALKRMNPRKLSGHALLPREAVEPICYTFVRLRRRILERRVPAQSNHGRNDHDFNQQSAHDV